MKRVIEASFLRKFSRTDWFDFRWWTLFFLDGIEPSFEICIFCPFDSFVDIGEHLHVRCIEEVDTLQSVPNRGAMLKTAKHKGDAFDS